NAHDDGSSDHERGHENRPAADVQAQGLSSGPRAGVAATGAPGTRGELPGLRPLDAGSDSGGDLGSAYVIVTQLPATVPAPGSDRIVDAGRTVLSSDLSTESAGSSPAVPPDEVRSAHLGAASTFVTHRKDDGGAVAQRPSTGETSDPGSIPGSTPKRAKKPKPPNTQGSLF